MSDILRRKLAERLAAARGFKNHTVSENDTPPSGTSLGDGLPRAYGTDFPLSHAQERMWFLHQLDPEASAFNVCVLWHLRGPLNIDALKKSANRITKRHSVFRTLYNTDDQGRARQRIVEDLPPQWRHLDLRNEPAEQREHSLQHIAQQASTAAFDLSEHSTLRLTLVTMNDSHQVLIMVGQHIVWDGPSFGIFSRELAEGYRLYLNDTANHHTPPAAQYIDFADWHRKQWKAPSQERSRVLSFWQSQLTPLPEPLELPTDFEHTADPDEAGQWCTESLNEDTTHALTTLAAREKLTVFEVVIAAIAVFMTRLARAPEVTIGTVASHRNLPELHNVIGNFGNVMPLRLQVQPGWSFRTLLHHSAKQCRAAFAHADVPFEYLLEHLNIPRGQNRNPLLDTMVTFLSHGMEAPSMEGLEVSWEKFFNATSQTDLSFDALLQHGKLQLQATWRRALYRPDTVPGHLKRLAQLLRQCVSTPDTPLAEHSLLLPGEQPLLTGHWGQRSALPAKATTMTRWFETTAHQWPHATAIRDIPASAGNRSADEASLSFGELNRRANALARWLCTEHIGPGQCVAIALARRKEWFIAMLATLKAGAAFVPIDPDYPREYTNRVLKSAKPSLVFMEAGEIPTQHTSHCSFEHAERRAQQADSGVRDLADHERRQPLLPSSPLCIVFTSGSSGEPKGVAVPHSAMVNLLTSHRTDLYHRAATRTGREHLRVGHAWSLAFDAAWQPTLWMFEGHQLHLFDTQIMHDPIALANSIIGHRLDFIELTPGMLCEVLPWLKSGLQDAQGSPQPGHVPAVLGFGGESVKPGLWKQITELTDTDGFNLYGPTEATVDAMIARAKPGEPPNIGRPVAGAQVYVLDHCLQLAPPGVPGELAIAGAGLAMGYLARGDLSASAFIANPHGAPGSRLYRTGDRVRWLPGGQLEYIGRIDEQVKIRGFRVEPMEVEASVEQLLQKPCAVVARPNRAGAMQLSCFIETGASASVPEGTEALQLRCAQSLPAHLVPSYFIPLERLPRLPNGKIHRRALTLPEGLEQSSGRAPRTDLERQLCQLMAQVLDRDALTIDDGFFEVGGDSISVVKLVSLARRHGLTLSARDVFDARCVARLATKLEQQAAGSHKANSGHDSNDTGLARPTPLMARYLALQSPLRRFAQVASLTLPAGIRETDIQVLLTALLERHALLRARLVRHTDGAPRLEVPAQPAPPLIHLENARLTTSVVQPERTPTSTGEDAAGWPRWGAAELARHLCEQLDPNAGRMMAAARVQGDENHPPALWLAIHHLVVDAASWHVIAGDLALGWSMRERRQTIQLPGVPTAWKSWANARPHYPSPSATDAPRGTLASIHRKCWRLIGHNAQCPATLLARRLGFSLAQLLPALTALAALRTDVACGRKEPALHLYIERHGREASAPGQELSRTVGWFARELSLPLAIPATHARPNRELTLNLLQRWCAAIAREDEPTPATTRSDTNQAWELGFNYLGELTASRVDEPWALQPQLGLLTQACAEHWPLLHDLDINAYYQPHNGTQTLHFDAIGPASHTSEAMLDALFQQLQQLIDTLGEANNSGQTHENLNPVTPLQWEILRHCQGDTDPWTTQMELTLEFAPQELTEEAQNQLDQTLRRSAARLLERHEALRAGFDAATASTFIPVGLEPHWQSLDWCAEPAGRQQQLLQQLRDQWYGHRFKLDCPPLLRFAMVRLGERQWQILIHCHHLLLDGWSVPRVLREWLGGALDETPSPAPTCRWRHYLGWLQERADGTAWRYWNNTLQALPAPTLLCPDRQWRAPSVQITQSLPREQSAALLAGARQAGLSHASIYQLAWARTLTQWLGQADIVFGLFDSARQAPLEGLEALVGLVTQLVPLRINTGDDTSTAEQLQSLQTRQLEWQTQAPVRLDSLEPYQRFGEFFDTLLVIENALDGDRDMTNAPGALGAIQHQSWSDSIGQAAGLFVYPGNIIDLRLCYDPLALDEPTARQLLQLFITHAQQVIRELTGVPRPHSTLSPLPETLTSSEANHE